MATKHVPIELDFSANTSKAQKSIRMLNKELDDVLSAINKPDNKIGLEKDLHKASRAAIELKQHLQNALNPETGRFDISLLDKSFKSMGKTLEDYRKELNRGGEVGRKAFDDLAKEIVNAEVPLKRTNALLADFADILQKTAKWQISSRLFNAFVGSLQEAYYYAQDLNESLNNIRIVTGKNIDQMAQFAKEANKAAQALSTTTTEYTNASLIYYQQGLSDSEVKERTDVTIKMANVSRESAETVSQQMTAVWNNFDNGSKSLEYYADVMTALGAATASSSAEIAEGLEKFAAIADTVGLSYEYATAALATVTATTRQSADIVGNSFKTLFARIQSLKLGETLDDGTTLNNYSQALAAVGISIKDTDGQLKDMNDILDEMGDKWTKLGKDQQVALAQTVAGVRQYSQLIALMDNWSFFQQNLGVAENAEGTLGQQADIYAESWEAASDRVKAAAEEIYSQLLDDKFFIKLNDFFAGFLNLISNTIDALGGLKGVLSGIGLILTKMYGKSLIESVSNFFMTEKKRAKQWFDAQEEALTQLQANYNRQDLTDTAMIVGEITQLQVDLGERVNELSEDQIKLLQEEINQLKIRAEEAKEYERIANRTHADALEAEKNTDQARVKRLNAEEKSDNHINKVLSSKKLDANQKENVEKAVEKYKKLSKELKGVTNKSKECAQAIKEIDEALGEVKNDKTFNGAAIATDIDEATKAIIEYEKRQENLAEKEKIAAQAGADLKHVTHEVGEEVKNVGEDIEKIVPEAKTMTDIVTGLTQSLLSIGMAISTLANLSDVWSDEDISTGQKLLSTLSAFSIVIPSVVSSLKLLNVQRLKVTTGTAAETILNSKLVNSLFNVSVAETNAAAHTTTFNIAIKGLLKTILPITLAFAGITAATVGLTYAFKAIKEASPEGQLKKAREESEALKTAFEETKQKAEDLISTFDKYNNLVNTLHDCTVGTEEWKDALEKVNEQVLELLDKYPELLEYVKTGRNGELYFDEEDIDTIIENANKATDTTRRASNIATLNKDLQAANINLNKTLLSDEFMGRVKIEDVNSVRDILKNNYKDFIGLKSEEEFAEKLKSFGDISDYTLNNLKYMYKTLEKDFKDLNNIEKRIKNYSRIETESSLKKEGFDDVIIALTEKTSEKAFNEIVNDIKNKSNEKKLLDVQNIWDRYSFATDTSFQFKGVKGKGDNLKFYYINNEGKTDFIPINQIAKTIASNEIVEKNIDTAKENNEIIKNIAKNLNNEILLSGIKNWLTTGSFDNLTKEQITTLQEKNPEQFLKEIIGTTNLDKVVENFGFNTAEELIEDFTKGLGNYNEIVKNYKAGMLEVTRRAFDQLDADSKFKELLTPDVQKSVMNILETAFKSRKNEGLSAIKGLFDDMDSTQIESFVKAIEDVDNWTNIASKDLEGLLKNNGIELELTEDQWELLLDSLKQSPYIISNVTKKYKELHDTLDKLQFGTEWDEKIYNAFGGNEKLDDYFIKTAEGTYQFIGSLKELNKLYSELNERAVEDFEKNIKQYQRVLYYGEDYYKNDPSFTVVANNKKIEDYLQLLEVAGEDTSDWRSKQAIGTLKQEDAIAIQEAVNSVDFGQMNMNLSSSMEQRAEAAQSFAELDNLLKKGLITEEIYAKVLKMAKNSADITDYEADKYHNLNTRIKELDSTLEDYNEIQQELNIKRKYYKDESLVNIIKKENENLENINNTLEQQIISYSKLKETQEEELDEIRRNLNDLGVEKIWDENNKNILVKYDELMEKITKDYQDAIAGASLKNNEAEVKAAKQAAEEEFNVRKEWLKRYEELYYNEIIDTENKLEEKKQKQYENDISFIENQFEAINAGINRTFRLAEVKKEYQDFLKTINSDFKGVIDKDYSNEKELFGISQEELAAQKKRLVDFSTEVQNLIVQGMDKDIVNSLAEDTYIDIYKEITSLASNFNQLQQNAWNNYLKGFDILSTQLDHVNNRAKRYTKELEYQKQLIELMYGDKAYDLMNDYYTSQSKNITSQIQSMQQQYAFYEERFKSLTKDNITFDINNVETWADDVKKAYDGMISSQEELNNLIVSGLQNFKDTYLNEVAKTISNLDNAVWGRDFDTLKANWDYVQNRAKNYLDKVTSTYKIQTLSNKIDMSISETSSLKTQQRLVQLKEKELEYLRKKGNLTQDDLDIAEARYQIALKENALEEAQKNKTSMKLTRDASGNWSYQYVADQDDILKKQQDLLDANQNLYEVSDRAYTNAIQLAIDAYNEYKQKLIEIANDTTLAEEEKNKKMQELQDTYLRDMKNAMNNANIYSHNQFMNITNSAQTLAAEVIKNWSDIPGGVEFEFKKALIHISETTKTLNQNIQELNYLAGDILGKDGIKNAFTEVDTEIDKVNKEISKLCGKDSKTIEELNSLKTVVDDFAKAWGTGKDSVKGQIEAAYGELDKYLKLYDKVSTAKTTDNSNTKTSSGGEVTIVPSLKIDTQTGSISNLNVKETFKGITSTIVDTAKLIKERAIDIGSTVIGAIKDRLSTALSQSFNNTKSYSENTNILDTRNTNTNITIGNIELPSVKNGYDLVQELKDFSRETSMKVMM